jgi:hypothetical protein
LFEEFILCVLNFGNEYILAFTGPQKVVSSGGLNEYTFIQMSNKRGKVFEAILNHISAVIFKNKVTNMEDLIVQLKGVLFEDRIESLNQTIRGEAAHILNTYILKLKQNIGESKFISKESREIIISNQILWDSKRISEIINRRK